VRRRAWLPSPAPKPPAQRSRRCWRRISDKQTGSSFCRPRNAPGSAGRRFRSRRGRGGGTPERQLGAGCAQRRAASFVASVAVAQLGTTGLKCWGCISWAENRRPNRGTRTVVRANASGSAGRRFRTRRGRGGTPERRDVPCLPTAACQPSQSQPVAPASPGAVRTRRGRGGGTNVRQLGRWRCYPRCPRRRKSRQFNSALVFLLALTKMMSHRRHELLHRDVKCLADSQ